MTFKRPSICSHIRQAMTALLLTLTGCGDNSGMEERDGLSPTPEESSQPTGTIQTGESASQTTGGCAAMNMEERVLDRERMVETQIARRGIKDERTLRAMRRTPRHWFVPERLSYSAYDDMPLEIGLGQTISQPYIVALMTEAIHINPGDRVLEIGTGSGYQTAVLSEMTDEVFTIEIHEELANAAVRAFQEHGYGRIRARHGDGYLGWPEEAPFDAIIVTCAPEAIPQPLKDQLKPGGRMCIPVGEVSEVQNLLLLTRLEADRFESRLVELVRFVPMTGMSGQR